MASARFKHGEMTLATTDLGEKHICPECGSRFYDLGKHPPVCPKCKTVLTETAEPAKAKKASPAKAKAAPAKKAAVRDEDEDDEDEDEDDDEDDDDDDFDDDDDDDDHDAGYQSAFNVGIRHNF